jgi:virginiamycin B lyase
MKLLRFGVLIFAGAIMTSNARGEGATLQETPLESLKIEAEIPKGGDFMGFGFNSIWMMGGPRLVRVDATSNAFQEIRIEGATGRVEGIAINDDAVWLPDVGSKTIYKLDPGSNKVTLQVPADISDSEGSIGIGGGSIWALIGNEHTLSRINSETGKEEGRIALPGLGAGVAVDFGFVWVTAPSKDELYRIDPTTKTVTVISVGGTPRFITSGEGSMWILNQADGTVQRIDGKTGEVTATIEVAESFRGGDITVGGGYVWVTALGTPLAQIDPKSN